MAGPARFDLREIETVSVFRGDSSIILPNPLSRISASLWLAAGRPGRRRVDYETLIGTPSSKSLDGKERSRAGETLN